MEEEILNIEEAIKEAEKLLIQGIGTAEKEVVQEGSSKLEQTNRQEQLKKDIAWLRRQKETDNSFRVGDVSNRTYRTHRLDYGY